MTQSLSSGNFIFHQNVVILACFPRVFAVSFSLSLAGFYVLGVLISNSFFRLASRFSPFESPVQFVNFGRVVFVVRSLLLLEIFGFFIFCGIDCRLLNFGTVIFSLQHS